MPSRWALVKRAFSSAKAWFSLFSRSKSGTNNRLLNLSAKNALSRAVLARTDVKEPWTFSLNHQVDRNNKGITKRLTTLSCQSVLNITTKTTTS